MVMMPDSIRDAWIRSGRLCQLVPQRPASLVGLFGHGTTFNTASRFPECLAGPAFALDPQRWPGLAVGADGQLYLALGVSGLVTFAPKRRLPTGRGTVIDQVMTFHIE